MYRFHKMDISWFRPLPAKQQISQFYHLRFNQKHYPFLLLLLFLFS